MINRIVTVTVANSLNSVRSVKQINVDELKAPRSGVGRTVYISGRKVSQQVTPAKAHSTASSHGLVWLNRLRSRVGHTTIFYIYFQSICYCSREMRDASHTPYIAM